MCLATGLAPKCHFVPELPNGSPEIPKVGTLTTLGAHNFVQTFDWDEVWRKVVAFVKSFPMVCFTSLARKEIGAIPNF